MTLSDQQTVYQINNMGDSIGEVENDQFLSSDDDSDDLQLHHSNCSTKYIEDLPWFHGDMTRNTSEALLLMNGVEGSYLVRNSASNPGSYTVSVRCQNSIKHYSLCYDAIKKTYTFGTGYYDSYQELIDHFECKPVLTGESGPSVVLRFPYVRDVPEPASYEKVLRHAEDGKDETSYGKNNPEVTDLHIASKEGYLVKRGALHKNWKKRWFVLNKSILRYYANKDDSSPIRMIDLRHALVAAETECDSRRCISVVLPFRTFYFMASSLDELLSWFALLQWKINYYTNRRNSKRKAMINHVAQRP